MKTMKPSCARVSAYTGGGRAAIVSARSLTISNTFVNRYGLGTAPYASTAGRTVWAHNPNRSAAPYSSAAIASGYGAAAAVRTPVVGSGRRRRAKGEQPLASQRGSAVYA